MNKEVIGAVLVGLVIGFGVFVGVRQIGRVMNWWQQKPNTKLYQQNEEAVIKEEEVVKITQAPELEPVKFQVLSPQDGFLVKEKKLELKIQAASGSGVLIRINNQKVDYQVMGDKVLTLGYRLESGANLLEAAEVHEGLSLGQVARLNGVVTTRTYPDGARGWSGRLKEVIDDKIVVETDSGKMMEMMVVPFSKVYGFDEEGRQTTITKIEEKFIGRPVIVIAKGDNDEVIRLLILRDLEFEKLSYFKGKVSKVDDDKGVYQLVSVDGKVKEVGLKKVKLYLITGEEIKSDKVGLGDQVLLVYLGDELRLVVVQPQTNLLER